jgi:CO dehydrogenase maturation factor
MTVDYLMLQALEERERYSLLAMGHGDGPGCFCPVNSLLRESIEELARAFDWIVIDAEAGIEQVNRQVTRRVDYPLVVTDSSMRGASAAEAISSALLRVGSPAPTGVLFNRTVAPADPLLNRVRRAGLRVLGAIPMDPTIARFDHDGQSLLELPQTSPALQTLRKVLAEIG